MRLPLVSFAVLPVLVLPLVACGPAEKSEPKDEQKDDREPAPEPCVYPEATALTGVGSIMPNVSWPQAYSPDGTRIDFSLEDFRCNATYDSYTSLTFVIFAEWCPNCPEYLAYVKSVAAEMEAAGTYLVLLDLETREYALPTHDSAQAYVSGKIGNGIGLRVGEGDAVPAGLIYDSTIWSAVPGAWMVRKDDMKVIVNQDDTEFMLDLPLIASHLDADWSDPSNPPFFSNCEPGDEESSEPNDTLEEAGALVPGIVIEGGICNAAHDYYTIDVAGAWRLDLELDASLGDLDVYVIDPATGDALKDGAADVGAYTTNAVETFTHAGPATIAIVSYASSSSPYTLTLTEL
jgi:hypothetical protein